jgi:hypothetical protein
MLDPRPREQAMKESAVAMTGDLDDAAQRLISDRMRHADARPRLGVACRSSSPSPSPRVSQRALVMASLLRVPRPAKPTHRRWA